MSDPSPVLASEPSACCLKEGFKHEGTPVGKIITIAGVETYVSEPSETTTPGQKKVIMYFSDVWGALSNNAKLLQDYYASHGMYKKMQSKCMCEHFVKASMFWDWIISSEITLTPTLARIQSGIGAHGWRTAHKGR